MNQRVFDLTEQASLAANIGSFRSAYDLAQARAPKQNFPTLQLLLTGGIIFAAPTWQVQTTLALLALTSAALALRLARGRRTKPTHCARCNYDRTGLPLIAPCPECGSSPPSPAPAGEGVGALRDRWG